MGLWVCVTVVVWVYVGVCKWVGGSVCLCEHVCLGLYNIESKEQRVWKNVREMSTVDM